jgi:prepilin-type N-terminal cleavage/methylation domain-containing protein
MRQESGFSLVEVVIVMVLAGLLITASVVYALPWFGREDMRGAVYDVQTYLQLTKVQAVTRNRSCQFRLDAANRRLSVVDLNDPSTSSDDVELSSVTLPSTVSFADPSGGTPITLSLISGTTYQATFDADGEVSSGAGVVTLLGGSKYSRLTLFGAGGMRSETWDGSVWRAGT